MRYAISLMLCILSWTASAQEENPMLPLKHILLNGDSVSLSDLFLIRPGKILSIDTLYINRAHTMDTVYNVLRKPVRFVHYAEIKSRLNLNASEDPPLIIDGHVFRYAANFRIDKRFIRKIRFKDSSIHVKTRTKRSRIPNPCRGVGVAPQSKP